MGEPAIEFDASTWARYWNMDVKGKAFQSQLPGLLEAIADAHFIAIDLELSGIQSRYINKPAGLIDGGKQTLQQRYEETKEAAEKYQVLQIGLTCVKEDREKGSPTSITTGGRAS